MKEIHHDASGAILLIERGVELKTLEEEFAQALKNWIMRQGVLLTTAELFTAIAEAAGNECDLWVALNAAGMLAGIMTAHTELPIIAGLIAGAPTVRLDILELVPGRCVRVGDVISQMLKTLQDHAKMMGADTVVHTVSQLKNQPDPELSRAERRRFQNNGWTMHSVELLCALKEGTT